MKIEGWSLILLGTRKGIAAMRFGADSSRPAPAPWAKEAGRQLAEYFAGLRQKFDLPLEDLQGTPFQQDVWKACREIPYGRVSSYGALARRIGRPGAARAVGQALGANPLPLLIPCHRVVTAQERLGGFSGGVRWKKKLLRLEDAAPGLWNWNDERS